VTSWLISNSFSDEWVTTFKNLNLEASDLVDLGIGRNGRGNMTIMHHRIYPELARVCTSRDILWDQSREREEGKRLRKLLNRDMKAGIHDDGPEFLFTNQERGASATTTETFARDFRPEDDDVDPFTHYLSPPTSGTEMKMNFENLSVRDSDVIPSPIASSASSRLASLSSHQNSAKPVQIKMSYNPGMTEALGPGVAPGMIQPGLPPLDWSTWDQYMDASNVTSRPTLNTTVSQDVPHDFDEGLPVFSEVHEAISAPNDRPDDLMKALSWWRRPVYDSDDWAIRVAMEELLENVNSWLSTLSPHQIIGEPTRRPVYRQVLSRDESSVAYVGVQVKPTRVLVVKEVVMAGDNEVAAAKHELDRILTLGHSRLVQCLGYGTEQDQSSTYLDIYLEYVSGGSIETCLKTYGKLEEPVVKSVAHQTLDGLQYLHKEGFVHGSLKAGNILLDLSGSCKLSGFGISIEYDTISANSKIISAEGSCEGDLWNFGLVVLEMFSGRRLGSGTQDMPQIPADVLSTISVEGISFIYDVFTKYAATPRPTEMEIENIIDHDSEMIPLQQAPFLNIQPSARLTHRTTSNGRICIPEWLLKRQRVIEAPPATKTIRARTHKLDRMLRIRVARQIILRRLSPAVQPERMRSPS